MASRKPTLVLTTPVSATFPAEALKSAASVRTPHSALWRESLASAGLPSAGLPSAGLPSAGLCSAGLHSPMVAIKTEDGLLKTPITPPLAYMDFLKLASPVLPSPGMVSPNLAGAAPAPRPRSVPKPAPTAGAGVEDRDAAEPSTDVDAETSNSSSNSSSSNNSNNSSPLTAESSATTECSCDCERPHRSPKVARIDTSMPPSPFKHYPMSAPAIGRTTFPSLAMPASPAVSNNTNNTNNAGWADSPVRSPFSAKSVASHFDWETALKARYTDGKPPPHTHSHPHAHAHTSTRPHAHTSTHPHGCAKPPSTASRTSVRHIREVVTRTVTYTPRMNPPPKGKKRKVQCDGTACS